MRNPRPTPDPTRRGYHAAPSREFIARGRNPALDAPARFEPTVKKPGEFVLTGDGRLVQVGVR